jgi:hypothetical protein
LSSCGPAHRLYVIDVQAELGITPNRDTSEKERLGMRSLA